MVNLSSISGCGVIIQHYSLHIAPIMVNLSSLGCSNAIIQQRVSLSTLIMLTYHTPVYTLTERLQEFFYNQRTHPCAGLSRNYLTEALAQCDATRRNPASSNELHTKLED